MAPDPEFVLLYRQGTPTSAIAEGAGAAATTVRYHLQIAAQQDPGLREEHQAALASPRRRTVWAGRRNLSDVLAFYRKHGRLPGTHEKTPRKRALGMWLLRRRQEAAAGTFSPVYREALAVIPGWDTPSTRKTEDEVRWQQRLDRIRDVRSGGGDWPRHQKTDDRDERTLGVWLHTQRIDYRAGRMDPVKAEQLNDLLPGWREGRRRSGQKPRTAPA